MRTRIIMIMMAMPDTCLTRNKKTDGKKLVEYGNICLGSDDPKGEAKLGKADQNPNKK